MCAILCTLPARVRSAEMGFVLHQSKENHYHELYIGFLVS